MRKLNCRPGELAIVINSFDSVNIGSIVKVLGRDARASHKAFMWKVHAKHLLTYAKGDKHFRRTKGSLADTDLQPIRGYPLGMDIAIGVLEADERRDDVGVFQVVVVAGAVEVGGHDAAVVHPVALAILAVVAFA